MKLVPVLMLAAVLVGGCGKSAPQPAAPPPAAPGEPTQAQPRLQTLKLWLGAEEMKTEVAATLEQIRTGMMFRTEMGENEAMIFVFSVPHQASFWMKNTRVPLSAAYINPQGVIAEIHDLQPYNTNSVTATGSNIQYVLETPQGWFQRHHVGVGTAVRTERGSLAQTFFSSRR